MEEEQHNDSRSDSNLDDYYVELINEPNPVQAAAQERRKPTTTTPEQIPRI